MAAEFSVVHLKIRHRATGLTPPAVATQDLPAQARGPISKLKQRSNRGPADEDGSDPARWLRVNIRDHGGGNQSPDLRPQYREQNESYGARSEAARKG